VGEGEPSSLAEGIRRLLEDGSLWTRSSAANRTAVTAGFDRLETLPPRPEVFVDALRGAGSSHAALGRPVAAVPA
jgi:hypothetical protein